MIFSDGSYPYRTSRPTYKMYFIKEKLIFTWQTVDELFGTLWKNTEFFFFTLNITSSSNPSYVSCEHIGVTISTYKKR